MPIWHQSPKLTPRYFLETPRLFGYPVELKFLFEKNDYLLYSSTICTVALAPIRVAPDSIISFTSAYE